MKRTIALLCAALLACLCFSCGEKKPEPGPTPETVPLLKLFTDTQPLRVATQAQGVTVTLQEQEYESALRFLRPFRDVWEETLEPGKEYELPADVLLSEGIPQYRLLARQGENIAIHNLAYDGKDGNEVFEIKGGPWAPAPIDENSPMANLCRAAAVASGDTENVSYWYVIANAITTLRGVYNEWPPDEEDVGAYYVPEWLFEAYAQALFPDTEAPGLPDWSWIGYDGANGRYLAYMAYSTWLWADYKSAKRNPDGTWDVTVAVSAEGFDEEMEETLRLAPNKAYNPDSPFEYHIVGLLDQIGANPAPPPPEILVGTWRAPAKRGQAAWLEIFEDGMAGLYLGDDESNQLYEIYRGGVYQADDVDIGGTGVDYLMDMEFSLDWYIYESDGGTPVTGVPDSYKGTYVLRHEWEGDQQVLYVKANDAADPLFGQKELKMLWVPLTLGGGSMVEIEAVG